MNNKIKIIISIIRSSNIAIWFTWGSYFLFKALRPMKLRKDIALAGWIIDNEDKVNEVLREEVDSKKCLYGNHRCKSQRNIL